MNNDKEPTIDVARRVLAELADMAEHASMTRALSGGEASAAQAYNRVLATFTASGVVPQGMFEPIPVEGTDFGPIGVQCRLLLAVVSGGKKAKDKDDRLHEVIALAPFLNSEDLGKMVMERLGESGQVPGGLLPALAPFLDSDTLGQIVRRQMNPSPPPQPPAPPEPASDLRPVVHSAPLPTLEELASRLRDPELAPEARQAIATRLADLAVEHSARALG